MKRIVAAGQRVMSRDDDHLKLLAIFHYVLGAMTVLFCSFPLMYVFIGLMFIFRPDAFDHAGGGRGAFPDRAFGLIFVGVGAVLLLLGWTLGVLTAYAGRCISRREKHTFCLVVAGLNCFHQPFGTALGIFTFIVLLRDSVKQLFEANTSPAPPPGNLTDR
jgi:hypothetical protein